VLLYPHKFTLADTPVGFSFFKSLANAKSKRDLKWLLQKRNKLECGPMPNVTDALPNTGGALCSTPQSLADAHY